MSYSSQFTLSKRHFVECFEQSDSIKEKTPKRFIKVGILALLGLWFYYVQIEGISGHLGAFFFLLAFVEFLSLVYAKPWWVTRQMWSKAAGNDVDLLVDDIGIHIDTGQVKNSYLYTNIETIIDTEKGFILMLANGARQYLSFSCLSEEATEYIKSQVK